jgi:putative spermidine/putrescine transport system ATP-binding protein
MKPRTAFVASFVGTSNVLQPAFSGQVCGEEGLFSLRPEHILLNNEPGQRGDIRVSALIQEIHYQGAATRLELRLSGGEKLLVSEANPQRIASDERYQIGQQVTAVWPRSAMVPLLGEG